MTNQKGNKMCTVLQLSQLLALNNTYYSGECFYVEVGGEKYSFIKGMMTDRPRRYEHSLYNVNIVQPGAYVIREIFSGKIYFGSSKNIYKRITGHKAKIERRKHENHNLNSLMSSANVKTFELIVIFTKDRESAYSLEQHLLDQWEHPELLLNIAHDARTAMKGAKLTQEHRKNISKANTGRIISEEARAKISESRKNSPLAVAQLTTLHENSRRKVMVDFVEYESITKAREATGLSETIIRKRIARCTDGSCKWLEASKNSLAGRTLPMELRQKLSAIKKASGMEQFRKAAEQSKRPIILNGVLYKSVKEAVASTGISEPVIHRKLKACGGKNANGPYVLDYKKPTVNKVLFNEQIYASVAEAASVLGISKNTMKSRVREGLASYV